MNTGNTLEERLAVAEREIIRETIDATSSRREAAKRLGISREGLYKKMLRLGLQEPGERGLTKKRGKRGTD